VADFDETVAGLRAWAAVGSDQGTPYIRWDRAARFAASAPRCSSSEMTVLTTAFAIAGDSLGLCGLGRNGRRAVVEAFAVQLEVNLGEAAEHG
jgi:hypothetical protein